MIISSAIMLLLETTPSLQRFLSNWFFLYLARISFMLYLTHGFLYCNPQTKSYWVQATPFMHTSNLGKFTYVICVSCISFISSDFFSIWIDGSTLDFSNFFVSTILTDGWDFSLALSTWTLWPLGIFRYIRSKIHITIDTYRKYFHWSHKQTIIDS